MTIAMSNGRESTVEVITSVERQRRWIKEEKLALVRQTFEPGQTVSMVARHAGVAASHLPEWFEHYNEVHPHSALKYLSPRALKRRRDSSGFTVRDGQETR